MEIILFIWLLALLPQIMAGKSELQAVIQGNSHFTKQLYNVLSQEPGNVFFSPISAHTVLAMAFQGAKGSTQDAFTKALGVNATEAAEGYKDVLGHLNTVPDVQLLMANKIYIMQGHTLQKQFNEVTQKKFLSEVEPVNFGDSVTTANNINGWVEKKTQNKIKNLIQPDSLDSLTRLVLVNAIYFKGNWASKFDKNLTKTEKFYLNDNDSIDVEMMNNKGKYFYKEDEHLDAKVLELPYANPDVSLIVILPNKRNGIGELEQKLADTDLTKVTENMFRPEVTVKLPKFKIETTMELNEPLEKIGLGDIFKEDKADFSGMLESPDPLYVSKVIQKAFIEVNEEGTEAAAATGLTFQLMSIELPVPPAEFFADHPFVVVLKSRGSVVDEERQARIYFNGIALFQGRVLNPKA